METAKELDSRRHGRLHRRFAGDVGGHEMSLLPQVVSQAFAVGGVQIGDHDGGALLRQIAATVAAPNPEAPPVTRNVLPAISIL